MPGSPGRDAPLIVVAAALVDDLRSPTRLLAARRHRPAALAGRWEFPGGKVHPDEDPLAALHREIHEELGVAIEVGDEVPGPDAGAWQISPRYALRLWTATVVSGEPQPLAEHDELRWLELGTWSSVPWLDADVRIVHLLTVSHGQGPAAQP
ncbi:MAG TPA: (deoxy)nucleoside triphosphate pyrophosphohydrolase [Actinotalea sp.]